MKKIVLILTLYILTFLIYSCKGPEGPAGPPGKDGKDGETDKQIRMELAVWNGGTEDNQWTSVLGLIKFDKRNYIGVDSIIFVANIYTYDTTNFCIAELFNYDGGIVIQNSTIQSNTLYSYISFTQSGNIYQTLPDKEINIGLRFRSSVKGKTSGIAYRYLFLYRK